MLIGYVSGTLPFPAFSSAGGGVSISAWASALLVQLVRAMRRPWIAGRVTSQIPALFLFFLDHL